MSEHFLQSEDESSVGTVNEVLDAILAKFPGSEKEEARMAAVRIDGEHAADVYALSVDDDDEEDEVAVDDPAIAGSPVAAFNILGDDDSVVVDFLVEKFGVMELDM